MFIKIGYHYLQIGVASFGVPSQCGRYQGGFARLTPSVLSWIKKMMKDEDSDQNMPLEYKRVSSMSKPGCGKRIDSEDPEIRSLEHPWLVDICVDYQEDKVDSSGNKITCSKLCKGTLITHRDVITSASCVRTSDENNTVVFLGKVNIQDSLNNLDYHFLSKNQEIKSQAGIFGVGVWKLPVTIYPGYSLNGNEEYKQSPDLALLKLENEVEFGPSVNKICLPTIKETEKDISNSKVFFASSHGNPSELTVKSNEWCENNFDFMKR